MSLWVNSCKYAVAATKQSMSHWVKDVISLVNEVHGLTLPLGIYAHSAASVATSQALCKSAFGCVL